MFWDNSNREDSKVRWGSVRCKLQLNPFEAWKMWSCLTRWPLRLCILCDGLVEMKFIIHVHKINGYNTSGISFFYFLFYFLEHKWYFWPLWLVFPSSKETSLQPGIEPPTTRFGLGISSFSSSSLRSFGTTQVGTSNLRSKLIPPSCLNQTGSHLLMVEIIGCGYDKKLDSSGTPSSFASKLDNGGKISAGEIMSHGQLWQ